LIREHGWANAIDLLAIKPEHFDTLHNLPYHHKDPFDRLLIAPVCHSKTNGKKISHLLAFAAFLNYNGGKLCGPPSPVERIAACA